jgi:hypothetical protein
MNEFYAGGMVVGLLASIGAIFLGGYNAGKIDGKSAGEFETRSKVVLYCIEKPDLCKEEYDSIKTQQKLNNYKLPEIK